MKIGSTGYAPMDMGKDRGLLTIHPASEGKSLLGTRIAGERFCRPDDEPEKWLHPLLVEEPRR